MDERQVKRRKTESDDPSSPPKPLNFDAEDMIILCIGSDSHRLMAHRSILARSSQLLEDEFELAEQQQKRVVHLPNEDPVVMTTYLNFVYRGVLPTHHIKALTNETRATIDRETFCLGLYLLGTRMLDKAIQNAVLAEVIRLACLEIRKKKVHIPDEDIINLIYARTDAASPARRLLVDIYSHRDTIHPDDGFCGDFMVDVAKGLLRKVSRKEKIAGFWNMELDINDYLI